MSRDQLLTLPTLLTILRVVLIPSILKCFMTHSFKAGFWLLIGALVTDVIDGAAARYLRQESYVGQLLDPLADKIFMGSILTAFSFEWIPAFSLPFWFWQIFVIKEALLIIGAFYIVCIHGGHTIKAGFWGKASMVLQAFLVTWIAWQLMYEFRSSYATELLLVINSLVMIIALCAYLNQLPFCRRFLCNGWLLRFWPS